MNQKDLIKYALIALGAYLIYEYIQKNGGLSGIFGTTAAAGTGPTPNVTGTGQTPAQIAAAAAAAKAASDAAAAAASGNAAAAAAAQKAVADAAAAQQAANLAAAAAAQKAASDAAAAAASHPCPDIMTWNGQNCVCPPGYLLGATTNTCVPQLVSQQMVTAAGTSDGLSMDQWCYEYTAVTGQQCPLDPGSITAQQYIDAGVQGDRSTPTNISTWLSFMNVYGGANLSGLRGLGAMRYTPAWLM